MPSKANSSTKSRTYFEMKSTIKNIEQKDEFPIYEELENIMEAPAISDKPAHHHEIQFSESIFKTPKPHKIIGDKVRDKVTEGKKLSSTESLPSWKEHDKTSTRRSTTKTPCITVQSITEKEWTSLKEAEDLVKSVPNYKTTPMNKQDDKNYMLISSDINTDMVYKHGNIFDKDYVSQSQIFKLMDKRIEEEKTTDMVTTTSSIYNQFDAADNVDESIKKTTATIGKGVSKERYTFKTTDSTPNHAGKLFIDDSEKGTNEFFDKMITTDKSNEFISSYTTVKNTDTVDSTLTNTNGLTFSSKHDSSEDDNDIDKLLNKLTTSFTTFEQTPTEGFIITLSTLDKNAFRPGASVRNEYSLSKYDNNKESKETTKAISDLYLIVEPKNKTLKSYFTTGGMNTQRNTHITNEEVYFNVLKELGIEVTSEYNAKTLVVTDFTPSTQTVDRTTQKNDIDELYKDVIAKYESMKAKNQDNIHQEIKDKISVNEENQGKFQDKTKMKEENQGKFQDKISKVIGWERIKKFFGHDRVCNCKCKENKTLCTVCAASDAVMRELSFEFNNLAEFMNTHCTEIQTFFYVNPSGGKKLRDSVRRIDKTLQDYYRRVKGKCAGRTCKTFSTYLDKRRNSDKLKLRRKYLKELLQDLESK